MFFLSFLQVASGQTLNKKSIDWWVTKCDTNVKSNLINLYLIDGNGFAPADSLKLNSVLKKISYRQLLSIDFHKTEEVLPTTEVPGRIIIIVSRKGNQSLELKKQLLKEAISKYEKPKFYTNHIQSDSPEPVLTVNDKLIFHSDCYHELLKIRKSSIYAINIYSHHVPEEYYGQNAKNGLVQIWTHP
jgi:hypothetical protein